MMLALVPLMGAAQAFDGFVAQVEANNPALAAERASEWAAVMTRVAENRVEATEIGFSYKWGEHPGDGNKLDFEVSQSFDWPGVYGARKRAARRAQDAGQARLQASKRALRLQVRTLLCGVVDANLRCDMLGEIVANLDSLHESMHYLLETRQITELDHRKVALEEVDMKSRLAEAERARAATLSELAALNGGMLPAGVADLREYPAEKLQPLVVYLHGEAPEVEALRGDAATMELDAKAERMALYPGFSVGYGFEREGTENFHGFSIGLRLPSYGAKPKAQAVGLEAAALEHKAEEARLSRRAAITADHAAAEISEGVLADYQRAFGSDYPHLLKRSLVGGQISYIEYFSELNFYLTARLDYLSQLLEYHTLLARLQSL